MPFNDSRAMKWLNEMCARFGYTRQEQIHGFRAEGYVALYSSGTPSFHKPIKHPRWEWKNPLKRNLRGQQFDCVVLHGRQNEHAAEKFFLIYRREIQEAVERFGQFRSVKFSAPAEPKGNRLRPFAEWLYEHEVDESTLRKRLR